MLTTPESIRTLQRKLYRKAKQEPACRFHALYDKVYRADILSYAYDLVRANKGSAGIDGVNFADIEAKEGAAVFVAELAEALRSKRYKPDPVKRVMIPKQDDSKRPLGIPTIRDRVAQMAVKLVIEPIFEADFCDNSYGFRPKRSAHDAIDDVAHSLHQGYSEVIDADISKYFDTIPHAKLMTMVAERICDGALLQLIQMWLKAPVMEVDKDGAKRNIGGGKGTVKGRRKAESSPRCCPICFCTFWTGSGKSGGCSSASAHGWSVMRTTSWCSAARAASSRRRYCSRSFCGWG